MNDAFSNVESRAAGLALLLETAGSFVIRYGMALILLWIGTMKFTEYEAVGIQPLVASSPFMSWLYGLVSVREFSTALGIVEIGIALLIVLRPWAPLASAVGSAAAAFLFLTTLSFLLSAPGWEPSLGGFPALSASVGQFLIKDLVLLGTALWTCGEAYSASQARQIFPSSAAQTRGLQELGEPQ
jgi:reactive chlorine resistance protein C